MDKRGLSERDICTKFITPALVTAGWDVNSQIREEVSFTKGRIIVRGKMVRRGEGKRADYIVRPRVPLEDLVEMFRALQSPTTRVGAVFVTASGKSTEKLQRLITPWDVLGADGE